MKKKTGKENTTDVYRIRHKFGLSHRQLTEYLGVSHLTAYAWERGKAKPIRRLQQFLDCLERVIDEKKATPPRVKEWIEMSGSLATLATVLYLAFERQIHENIGRK